MVALSFNSTFYLNVDNNGNNVLMRLLKVLDKDSYVYSKLKDLIQSIKKLDGNTQEKILSQTDHYDYNALMMAMSENSRPEILKIYNLVKEQKNKKSILLQQDNGDKANYLMLLTDNDNVSWEFTNEIINDVLNIDCYFDILQQTNINGSNFANFMLSDTDNQAPINNLLKLLKKVNKKQRFEIMSKVDEYGENIIFNAIRNQSENNCNEFINLLDTYNENEKSNTLSQVNSDGFNSLNLSMSMEKLRVTNHLLKKSIH